MQTNPIWIHTGINNQAIMCNGQLYGKFSVGKLCCYSINCAGWCPKLVMAAFGWPVCPNCCALYTCKGEITHINI